MTLLSSRAGRLSGRLGPRLFMTAGPLVMAAGTLLLLLVAEHFDYWWQVLPAMIVLGGDLHGLLAPGQRYPFAAPVSAHHLLRAHATACLLYTSRCV